MPNCRLRPTRQGLSLPRKGITRRKLEPHPVQVSAECSKMSLKILAHRKVAPHRLLQQFRVCRVLLSFGCPVFPAPISFLRTLWGFWEDPIGEGLQEKQDQALEVEQRQGEAPKPEATSHFPAFALRAAIGKTDDDKPRLRKPRP